MPVEMLRYVPLRSITVSCELLNILFSVKSVFRSAFLVYNMGTNICLLFHSFSRTEVLIEIKYSILARNIDKSAVIFLTINHQFSLLQPLH